MNEKCLLDPNIECQGLRRAEEVAGDLKVITEKIDTFWREVKDTNNRFGGRIGKLEACEEVRVEQYKHLQEKIGDITDGMRTFQKENKDSITELRKEHKESMEELRKGNKEILDAVTPLKHKVENLEHLSEDVEELKEKPGKTWENIKTQALGWAVAVVLALIAAALGISKLI